MTINTYKTEQMIYGKLDVVFHRNAIEAADWKSQGMDTKVFYQDGANWVESGTTKLELMP